MDTNHEMNPSVSGEHNPLACWRWLPAVANFFSDESNREQDLESRLLEMTVRR